MMGSFRTPFIPAFFRQLCKVFVVFLIITSLFRLVFLFKYGEAYQNYSIAELIKPFVFGLRFDISITLLLLIPFWLFSLFPSGRPASKLSNVFFGLTLIPFILGLVIFFVDLTYFGEAGRRLSYEVFQVNEDMASTFQMIRHYHISFIAFGILSFIFLKAMFRFVHFSGPKESKDVSIFSKITWNLIFIMFFILGVRGGLQSKPLRPSFAYLIGDAQLAHLSLNPIYTVFYALKKGDIKILESVPPQEAIQTVQQLLQTDGMSFGNPDYPLLQTPLTKKSPPTKKNVVVIVLESWAAKYVGALGNRDGITPQFDRLAEQGLFFKNFFAISHRSTSGIAATLCSLPSFEDMQILNTSLEQNNYRCLGKILGEEGYSTLFLHGAKTGSFGLNAFSQLAGFKKYLGKEDFDLKENESDPTWGMFDHVALKYFNKELASLREPFAAVWFSLTTHAPFHLPNEKYKVTDPSNPDHEFIDTLKYADESLGNFFNAASQEPYFKNTIFVILADHTSGTILNGTTERQHIPCLIYSPGLISPQTVQKIGGQFDILPTVLDLLNIRSSHHSFGTTLVNSPDKKRFVFVDRGGYRGWFRGDDLLLSGPHGPIGLFHWKEDPAESNNLLSVRGAEAQIYQNEILSYIQTAKTLIRDNRLTPK